MKILLITQEDYLAGSTYSVSYLANELAARGHQVWVGARPESLLQSLLKTNVSFFPVDLRSRFDFSGVKRIARLVREEGIQIINAQSSKDRYVSVLVKWFYYPSLLVFHTRRQVSLSIGGPIQKIVYEGGTDKIIAVSEGVKNSLIGNGIPDDHIEVIHNGTPPSKYQEPEEEDIQELKTRYEIMEGDIVIGCVSRRKMQHQLLQSLDYLGKPVKVILVGIDNDEMLSSVIDGFKYPHCIYFTGQINNKQVIAHYKLFTLHVLCSVTEGLSQSLLESMFLRVPVIATAAAGNLDLIQHEENGLLFENADLSNLAGAMTRLIEDHVLRS